MREAVLITYMGAPSNLKEIKPFLYRLFSDRDLINFGVPEILQKPLAYLISTFRAPKVKPQYEAIGGGSPLVRNSLEQSRLVEEKVKLKTFVGMLYSEPLLERTAEEILKAGIERLYHITLYPQFSYGTVGACIRDVDKLLKGKKEIRHVKSWTLNKNYLNWIRELLKKELRNLPYDKTVVLFSAHSLPKYFVEKKEDPYPEEVRRTASEVMKSFPEYKYKISYQSKVGPIEWLEPSTEETLRRIREEGFKSVVVFPISFVSEHIETLYELDVEYGNLARDLGLDYRRVKLDHKHPLLISAISEEINKLRKN
ncbi:MAG: ferrochelatase [Thermovibrio sp.]|nr:MAG: ferrochelatase [Thermovibrio sp.]